MERIISTVIEAGLEKPVKILHITDTHITESDENDDKRMKDLIEMRRDTFYKEGGKQSKAPQQYLEEAFEIAKSENALPVLTGDIMDLNSSGCRKQLHLSCDGHDFLFTTGTHEYQRSSCTPKCCPLEEPVGYYEQTRNALMSEFGYGDWNVDSRTVNGLNIITVDNSQSYFPAQVLPALKKVLENGLPSILFMHVPLEWLEIIRTNPRNPDSHLTEQDYITSYETVDFIIDNPQIIATFAGHRHREYECTLRSGQKMYETPGTFSGICRLIEIR